MTTNYHTALASTDDVNAETINEILESLDQQMQDMNDGTHAFSAIDVNGGAVDGTTIGANSAAAGGYTTLEVVNDLPGSALMVGMRQGQYVSSSSTDVVQWNRIYLDTDDAYSTSTYRWTPAHAGYYLLVAALTIDISASAKQHIVSIYKNGAVYGQGIIVTKGTFNESIPPCVIMAQANGTTDYFDVRFTNGDTGNHLTITDDIQCWFAGGRVY